MTEFEIKRRFRQAGCWRIVAGAKHDMAINDVTGQKIPIPRHPAIFQRARRIKS